MRLGIVDMGTNSVRFSIFDVLNPMRPKNLYREKIMLRPGRSVFASGRMPKDNIERITQVFQQFSRRAERFQVENIKAFATSALREAENRAVVIRKVEQRTGIKIHVISGLKEAELIAQGVLHFDSRTKTGQWALIDIGGGSTEINLIKRGRILASHSLRLGALRLSQIYFQDGFCRGEAILQTRKHVRKVLRSQHRHLTPSNSWLALGSSGTIRAVYKLIKKNPQIRALTQMRRRPGDTHVPAITNELQNLIEWLLPRSNTQMIQVPGMEKRRVDILLPGLILLQEILDFLQVRELHISPYSLRDGILIHSIDELLKRKSI